MLVVLVLRCALGAQPMSRLKSIAAKSRVVRLADGDTVYREGEQVQDLCLVLTGHVVERRPWCTADFAFARTSSMSSESVFHSGNLVGNFTRSEDFRSTTGWAFSRGASELLLFPADLWRSRKSIRAHNEPELPQHSLEDPLDGNNAVGKKSPPSSVQRPGPSPPQKRSRHDEAQRAAAAASSHAPALATTTECHVVRLKEIAPMSPLDSKRPSRSHLLATSFEDPRPSSPMNAWATEELAPTAGDIQLYQRQDRVVRKKPTKCSNSKKKTIRKQEASAVSQTSLPKAVMGAAPTAEPGPSTKVVGLISYGGRLIRCVPFLDTGWHSIWSLGLREKCEKRWQYLQKKTGELSAIDGDNVGAAIERMAQGAIREAAEEIRKSKENATAAMQDSAQATVTVNIDMRVHADNLLYTKSQRQRREQESHRQQVKRELFDMWGLLSEEDQPLTLETFTPLVVCAAELLAPNVALSRIVATLALEWTSLVQVRGISEPVDYEALRKRAIVEQRAEHRASVAQPCTGLEALGSRRSLAVQVLERTEEQAESAALTAIARRAATVATTAPLPQPLEPTLVDLSFPTFSTLVMQLALAWTDTGESVLALLRRLREAMGTKLRTGKVSGDVLAEWWDAGLSHGANRLLVYTPMAMAGHDLVDGRGSGAKERSDSSRVVATTNEADGRHGSDDDKQRQRERYQEHKVRRQQQEQVDTAKSASGRGVDVATVLPRIVTPPAISTSSDLLPATGKPWSDQYDRRLRLRRELRRRQKNRKGVSRRLSRIGSRDLDSSSSSSSSSADDSAGEEFECVEFDEDGRSIRRRDIRMWWRGVD